MAGKKLHVSAGYFNKDMQAILKKALAHFGMVAYMDISIRPPL